MSGAELSELSTEDIQGRIAIGAILDAQLLEDPDEESEAARRVLEEQMSELRTELAKREGEPPPVVIGLKTAYTKAVNPSLGG
jgi:hypothetical protein